MKHIQFKRAPLLLVGVAAIAVCAAPILGNKPDVESVVPDQVTQTTLFSVKTSVENVNNPVNDVNNSVDEPTIVEPVIEEPAYTEEEHEILAIIIYQEAGGDMCSDETRMMVGNVFLNRVDSPLFPDTFEEVATGKWQYGRLYETGIKWPDRASLPQEQAAVQRAYDTAERLLEGERVLPKNVIWQAEFTQGDGVYCESDGLYFCYSEVTE